MTEEFKNSIQRMEKVAEHTFARAEKELMSGREMPIIELYYIICIAKDSAKLMKYTVEMRKHYEHHSDKML